MKLFEAKLLEWNPALRAAIFMLPMLVAYFLGYQSLVVPLGQGGFFYSTIFLPMKRLERIIYMFLLLSFGMGIYLLGGNVGAEIVFSLIITFVFVISVGLLSGMKFLAPVAFSFISIYTAGLNSSSLDKLHTNFLGFAFIFAFCGLISLLPFWKSRDISSAKVLSQEDNLRAGIKMGMGASIALFIANLAGFAKLGWPVTAVGSIVRFNEVESRARAMSRVIGTVGGGILAMFIFFFITNPVYLILIGFIFGVLNNLFMNTKIGKTVFFYTTTILILYSLSDISLGPTLAVQRIAYNMVGVLVAIFVMFYPFPFLMRRLDKVIADYYSK
jgi:hypothetical protein